MIEGRWIIFVCAGCGGATGRHQDCDANREATPVVPCDAAALDRAAHALAEAQKSRPSARDLAEVALRAAAAKDNPV